MSLRSFVVFQDAPPSNSPQVVSNAKENYNNSLPLVDHATHNMPMATLNPADKENVHPVTGERSSLVVVGKKRKPTAVLATKVHAPIAMRKPTDGKDGKDTQPETKKRKSSAPSGDNGAKKVKKDAKKVAATRKPTKRRASPLPKLDEEEEGSHQITQATIDSKCYDLTVQPLADVSQAFDQALTSGSLASADGRSKLRCVKASSAEPEIRDYFSDNISSAPNAPKATAAANSVAFSTPERKRIYTAFTFSSPSPTKQRLSKTTRSASVPPLHLV
ncbi:hypothetical protein BD779DRAFT_1653821 [Infundibulicybe gibba]|nr:hypothetical protein BD779DRAFT_1653821 [Infundibulicybe gibba]